MCYSKIFALLAFQIISISGLWSQSPISCLAKNDQLNIGKGQSITIFPLVNDVIVGNRNQVGISNIQCYSHDYCFGIFESFDSNKDGFANAINFAASPNYVGCVLLSYQLASSCGTASSYGIIIINIGDGSVAQNRNPFGALPWGLECDFSPN